MKAKWQKHFMENYYVNLNPRKSYKKVNPLLKRNIWQRAEGFNLLFDMLLKNKNENFKIVETGTCRSGKWSDGASSILFTDFVKHFGGSVRSVDINPKSVKAARELVNDDHFTVTQSDSVAYLNSLEDKDEIDLYFLDSYDVKWDNDAPSAEHHLKEFKEIEPYLKDCVVCIDDNTMFTDSNKRTGKGRMVAEYLESKGIKPIYDDYMIIYKF